MKSIKQLQISQIDKKIELLFYITKKDEDDTINNVYDSDRKNKLIDAKIEIKPDINFAQQTIRANIKQREIKQLALDAVKVM